MKSTLRPHQERAIWLLRKSLSEGHRRPLVQAPTGFGKTLLGSAMVEGALSKGKRIMFVVPAVSLIDQTVRAFYAEGIRSIGVIQADHEMTDYAQPVQVASVQTLQRRKIEHLPDVDLVIVDEAHRWFKFFETWFQRWNAIPFVGLSATPWTRGLGKHYDDLIIASTTADLIEQGYLSDFRVFAPSHPDLSKVRTVAGDYHEGDLAEIMGDSVLVSDVVRVWKDRGEGRPTLCFAVDRAHARKIQNDFLAAGVCAEYIDAYTPVPDREVIAKRFHAGEVDVVCNVGCLTTGIDWDVRCIILARPTKSEMLFVQMIGRGLRTADGKADCLILDHSDTHLRLGFVTDILHETLHDGSHKQASTREREDPLPKECPKCNFLKPARVHVCPNCQYKPERQSEIETVDGELSELSRQKKLNRVITPEEKARFFAELKWHAIDRGYKPGWASNQYRARFGVWPNKYKDAAPREPGRDTQDWILSQQIRYSKRRAA